MHPLTLVNCSQQQCTALRYTSNKALRGFNLGLLIFPSGTVAFSSSVLLEPSPHLYISLSPEPLDTSGESNWKRELASSNAWLFWSGVDIFMTYAAWPSARKIMFYFQFVGCPYFVYRPKIRSCVGIRIESLERTWNLMNNFISANTRSLVYCCLIQFCF